jgi:hypothetical protein
MRALTSFKSAALRCASARSSGAAAAAAISNCFTATA